MHVCEIKKYINSRPLSVGDIKITLWNEPEHKFTVRHLMMDMGFFVFLYLNSDHLTRRTLIFQNASTVIASSGDIVDVGSTVLCKPDHRDDEVSYSNAKIMHTNFIAIFKNLPAILLACVGTGRHECMFYPTI